MEVAENRAHGSNCPCWNKLQEYEGLKKLIEMKDSGFVIYIHASIAKYVDKSRLPQGVVVLHKTKNMKTAADVLPKLDFNKIPCPRCKQKFKHAQELVHKVCDTNNSNILGICDHCRLKAQSQSQEPCIECEKTIKQFLPAYTKQKGDLKIFVKMWLDNKRDQLKRKDYKDIARRYIRRSYSEMDVGELKKTQPKSLHKLKSISRSEERISEFSPSKEKEVKISTDQLTKDKKTQTFRKSDETLENVLHWPPKEIRSRDVEVPLRQIGHLREEKALLDKDPTINQKLLRDTGVDSSQKTISRVVSKPELLGHGKEIVEEGLKEKYATSQKIAQTKEKATQINAQVTKVDEFKWPKEQKNFEKVVTKKSDEASKYSNKTETAKEQKEKSKQTEKDLGKEKVKGAEFDLKKVHDQQSKDKSDGYKSPKQLAMETKKSQEIADKEAKEKTKAEELDLKKVQAQQAKDKTDELKGQKQMFAAPKPSKEIADKRMKEKAKAEETDMKKVPAQQVKDKVDDLKKQKELLTEAKKSQEVADKKVKEKTKAEELDLKNIQAQQSKDKADELKKQKELVSEAKKSQEIADNKAKENAKAEASDLKKVQAQQAKDKADELKKQKESVSEAKKSQEIEDKKVKENAKAEESDLKKVQAQQAKDKADKLKKQQELVSEAKKSQEIEDKKAKENAKAEDLELKKVQAQQAKDKADELKKQQELVSEAKKRHEIADKKAKENAKVEELEFKKVQAQQAKDKADELKKQKEVPEAKKVKAEELDLKKVQSEKDKEADELNKQKELAKKNQETLDKQLKDKEELEIKKLQAEAIKKQKEMALEAKKKEEADKKAQVQKINEPSKSPTETDKAKSKKEKDKQLNKDQEKEKAKAVDTESKKVQPEQSKDKGDEVKRPNLSDAETKKVLELAKAAELNLQKALAQQAKDKAEESKREKELAAMEKKNKDIADKKAQEQAKIKIDIVKKTGKDEISKKEAATELNMAQEKQMDRKAELALKKIQDLEEKEYKKAADLEFQRLLGETAKIRTEEIKKIREMELEEKRIRELAEKKLKEIGLKEIPIGFTRPDTKPAIKSELRQASNKNIISKEHENQLRLSKCVLRKPSIDDGILKLVKIKQNEIPFRTQVAKGMYVPKNDVIEDISAKLAQARKLRPVVSSELISSTDLLNMEAKKSTEEIIIDENIVTYCPGPPLSRQLNIDNKQEKISLDFQKVINVSTISSSGHDRDNIMSEELKQIDPEKTKGIMHYALSDRSFIEKGWTMLPTEKVVRKMNVYRMRPARPEFDWFERNKSKRLMTYDTGEKLADFDDNGRGRWFYRSGRLALDYYDAEEINAQQRFVVYSSGEPDERGRTHPITILATFDYLGNGIVFDHAGKIRLKYNQTEGVVLDRNIGPVSHWKWHTLNDPPVLQQVMMDTQMAHKDPTIYKMPESDHKPLPANEDMIAIEFDNFIKEKNVKLTQKFKPFQIKMKALKINEHFSLRVLDQATVYLIFRDGSTNLKLNIGMVLDHREIVDTDTAEVGEVSNSLERLPARTDSLAALQRSIAFAQHYERTRTERERRTRPTMPCASADKLAAPTSRPLRPPVRTAPSAPRGSASNSGFCVCSRKPTSNLYYNSRLM